MHTIKLVVIGSSGVGKTSLRGQYISGRFSTGYRATIGADFITKVLPHPTKQDEMVTLQIWDTAGQERFSSLSSAFFRGADAAVLMFDVNSHETMKALINWWDQFKTHAPLSDEEMGEFCCVVVGNKLDLVQKDGRIGNGSAIRLEGNVNGTKKKPVSRGEAESFLKELVPNEFIKSTPIPEVVLASAEEETPIAEELEAVSEDDEDPLASSQVTLRPHCPEASLQFPSTTNQDSSNNKSESIAINGHSLKPFETRPRANSSSNNHSPSSPSFIRHIHRHKSQSKSRSRSANSRYYSGASSSGFSIYHTPSSSVYDQFESARTSPEPWEASSSSGSPLSASYTPGSVLRSSSPAGMNSAHRPPRRRLLSAGNKSILSIDSMQTRSTSSVATVTPSLYAREHDEQEEHDEDWDQDRDHQGTVGSSAGSFFSALSRSFSSASIAPAGVGGLDNDGSGDSKLGKFKHSPLRLQLQANHFVPPTPTPPKPPALEPPDCGPRLFLTSAKTGEGVTDVFEYIAKRVVSRWEWEERIEASRFEFREGDDGTWSRSWGRRNGHGQGIKLGARIDSGRGSRSDSANWNSCCS